MLAFDWLTAVFLFFSYLGIDALYSVWMLRVTQKQPVKAAIAAAATMILIVLATISFTKSYLYAIPVALGSGVGTYLITEYERRKNPD